MADPPERRAACVASRGRPRPPGCRLREGAKRVTLTKHGRDHQVLRQPERRGPRARSVFSTQMYSLHTLHTFMPCQVLTMHPCQPRAAKSTARHTHRSQRRSYMASAWQRHMTALRAFSAFIAGALVSAAACSNLKVRGRLPELRCRATPHLPSARRPAQHGSPHEVD